MCVVINLYGGPGTGKSTTAAELFARMKKQGKKVELVREYAKDLTYDGRLNILEEDQLYVFAKQHRRMKMLHDHVDYIITDSPLLLSIIYGDSKNSANFNALVMEKYNRYDNLDIFIKRDAGHHPYQEYGRNQTEEQAITIDERILDFLEMSFLFPSIVSFNNDTMVDEILEILEAKENG